ASTCCSAKKEAGRHSTPDDSGCCAEVEAVASSSTLFGPEICGDFPAAAQTVVLKAMLACGGIVSQWLSLGGAPPPPVVVAVVSVAPLVEAILPGDAVFSCGRAAPDAPPPRVA
ncbi:hypothetical protein EBR56_08840, partial [bacterium]|nr:hypothetical protein [bacterium]